MTKEGKRGSRILQDHRRPLKIIDLTESWRDYVTREDEDTLVKGHNRGEYKIDEFHLKGTETNLELSMSLFLPKCLFLLVSKFT